MHQHAKVQGRIEKETQSLARRVIRWPVNEEVVDVNPNLHRRLPFRAYQNVAMTQDGVIQARVLESSPPAICLRGALEDSKLSLEQPDETQPEPARNRW